MKRLFLFVVFLVTTNFVMAQFEGFKTCSWHDGFWGDWKMHYHSITKLRGSNSGFAIYSSSDHPSKYVFRFQIDSYTAPDKKTIKHHFKNNEWYVYSGIAEYYVTDEFPTIDKILKAYEFPYFNCDSGYGYRPCVKRTAKATIKIAPYKEYPKCYNIFFDGVAVAIELVDLHFNQ